MGKERLCAFVSGTAKGILMCLFACGLCALLWLMRAAGQGVVELLK